MRAKITILCALVWLSVVWASGAALSAWWDGGTLRVVWASGEPTCLWLTGGGLSDTWLTCDRGGVAALPASGVDMAFSPYGRETLELRTVSGEVVARIPVPLRPDRFKVILPVVKSEPLSHVTTIP